MSEHDKQHDEHVEDLDAINPEEVKGGAAFDAFLEIDGVKAAPKTSGKWGDIVLKQNPR